MEKFDLVIIGGGPGGYEAAIEATKIYNMKVALIEKEQLGGTCLNKGCVPTKTLLHTVESYSHLKKYGETLGIIGTDNLAIDMVKLQERKNNVITKLREGIISLMKANRICVFNGIGQITSPNTVQITTYENGDKKDIETDNIIIATGSHPSIPLIPGAAKTDGVLTSNEILELSQPLNSLIIVGGGVIGCEFASLFASLGTKVTILEAMDRILPNMDKEISQSLKMVMKKSGNTEIHTKAFVKEIKSNGKGIACIFTEKDRELEISADKVLISIGRIPYTENLISEAANDEIKNIIGEKGFVKVNDNFQTAIPNIYAIGDVIGGIQLAHFATAEGKNAVAHIAKKPKAMNLSVVPSCIYTEPEIAATGLSSDEAKEKGINSQSKKFPMTANCKTLLSLQERSFMKVVYESETHKILGAQMMCARATDMISQLSQAIVNELTLEDLAKVIYPHPTFSESIGELAR